MNTFIAIYAVVVILMFLVGVFLMILDVALACRLSGQNHWYVFAVTILYLGGAFLFLVPLLVRVAYVLFIFAFSSGGL